MSACSYAITGVLKKKLIWFTWNDEKQKKPNQPGHLPEQKEINISLLYLFGFRVTFDFWNTRVFSLLPNPMASLTIGMDDSAIGYHVHARTLAEVT